MPPSGKEAGFSLKAVSNHNMRLLAADVNMHSGSVGYKTLSGFTTEESDYAQLFGCRREDLASSGGHHHRVLDAYAAKAF